MYIEFTKNYFPTNEYYASLPADIVTELEMLLEDAGYVLAGWEQKSYYEIRSGRIPVMIKYFVNNYGTGKGTIINLNSSNMNSDGYISVQYGLPSLSSKPYGGFIYGEYASQFAGQANRVEFLSAVYYNE